MLRKLRKRIQSEDKGFTLIELLVVILIIGILAAIALPAFLSQRAKGQDTEAKSNARNLVSQLESCYTQDQAYTNCATSEDVTKSGLPYKASSPADGEVTFVAVGTDGYTITAPSKSANSFTIKKVGGAAVVRECTTTGKGGCPSDGKW